MVKQPASAPCAAGRRVLDGVPRVGFYDGGPRCPEDFTFADCLRAYLEYLGVASGCEHAPTRREGAHPRCPYAFINGVSGLAARLLWNAERWDFGNGNILHIAADPFEPLRRTFAALGLDWSLLLRHEFATQIGYGGACCDDEDGYRQAVIASIRDRGRPVLGLRIVGPPEFCLIAGYDEGGDVLVGWSYFQGFPEFSSGVEIEPNGYFRKADWFKDTLGLIVIGDQGERPPLGQVPRQALQWTLGVVRTPRVRGYHSGLAAYTAWSEALLSDDQFPAGDMAALREHYGVHYDAVGIVAEGRWYGAQFLKEVAAHEPAMAQHLATAAGCWEAEHDLMWEVWNLAGGNAWTDEQVCKLAQPDVRRRIVPVILQARDKDAEAAEHIERALAK